MREFVSAESIFEDSEFYNKFCDNCPAKIHIPATLEEPEEWYCPIAGWECWSKDCVRYNDAKQIIDAFDDLNLMIEEILNG